MPSTVINSDASIDGGVTVWRSLSVLNTGEAVKASPGRVYSVLVANRSAAERFVKLYNTAAAPTASDTPVVTLCVPAGGRDGFAVSSGVGSFGTGIGIRATTGIADADNTAPAANDVVAHVFYR